MSQQTESNVIRLSQPGAGQTVTVPVDQENMRMALGFTPDPNAVAKNGQDLEFTFDDGGKIVLQGYYDHFAGKTLPVMVTDNGDELAGEDFLASLNEDLLTAAGPGAGGAPGGGSGEYADDPGALIDGISRLGSLGTIYWARETEVPEQYTGEVYPSGSAGFGISTDAGALFGVLGGLYEDGRPYQHIGGAADQLYAGRISFTPDPGPATTVSAVRLGGFPEGTQVWLGDPNDPDSTLVTIGPNGWYNLSEANFAQPGVYLIPPANSDDDFSFNAEVDFTAGGTTITSGVTVPVIVDAVADKPDLVGDEGGLQTGFEDPTLTGSMEVKEAEGRGQELKDGWAVDNLDKHADVTDSSASAEKVDVSVVFTTKIQFDDYTDNSETHLALVEVPNSKLSADYDPKYGTWTPEVDPALAAQGVKLADPATITLYFDPDTGACLGENPVDGAIAKEFFQFEVPNGYLAGNNGEADLSITFTSDDTNITDDFTYELETGAKAVEAPSDSELRDDNNVSYTFTNEYGDSENDPTPPNFRVDTIDSQLTVKAGWVSENNSPDKHLPEGADPHDPQWGSMNDPADAQPGNEPGIESDSTSAGGAPIHIGLDNSDPNAVREQITEVTFDYDDTKGTLYGPDGNAVAPGTTLSDAAYFHTTNGLQDGLADGFVFVPKTGYSDEDIDLGYTVKVESAETGSSATFTGTTTVVVDAVADIGTNLDVSHDTHTDFVAALPGADITVSGSLNFADQDGSEYHYVLVNIPGNWSVAGAAMLSKDDVREGFINEAAGHEFASDEVSLSPRSGSDTAEEYLLLEMPPLSQVDGGHYTMANGIEVRVTEANGIVTYDYFPAGSYADGNFSGDAFATVNQNTKTGDVTYEFDVTAPGYDSSETVYVKGISVESDLKGHEYDYDNNLAITEAESTPVIADKVTVRLAVSCNLHEDGMANQWTDTDGNAAVTGNTPRDNTLEDNYNAGTGMPISMRLVEADTGKDAVYEAPFKTDIVTEIRISLPTDDNGEVCGTLFYNGQELDPANPPAGVTWDAAKGQFVIANPADADNDFLDHFSFLPNESYSGSPNLSVSAEIASQLSGDTYDGDAVHVVGSGDNLTVLDPGSDDFNGYVHVESVADLADAAWNAGREHNEDGSITINNMGDSGVDEATGWFVTQHGGEVDSYTVNAKLELSFGDLDGSETGTVLIKAVAGISIVDPAGDGTTFLEPNSEGYWEIPLGSLATNPDGSLNVPLLDADGNLNLTVVVDRNVINDKADANLEVLVRTVEGESGNPVNDTTNDTAIRQVEGGLNVPTLESSFEVKVGWAYEGGNGTKYGGPDTGPVFGSDDPALGGKDGAQIIMNFSKANGEELAEGTSGDILLTVAKGSGTFYYNGSAYEESDLTDNGDGTLTLKVSYNQANSGKLTFKPADGYSDKDIPISYEARITDTKEGETFVIKGETTLVVDAVADLAEIDGPVGTTTEDNTSVVISVKTSFPDQDSSEATPSEGHYILVEAREGWTCEGATLLEGVFVDKDGKPLPPTGYNEATGEYLYNYPQDTPTMDFFQVKVTEYPQDGEYKVTLTPPKEGATDLEDLVVGTKVVEENLSGQEHDYLNNHAYDVDKIDVQVIDSGLYGKGSAYEDRAPEAHKGGGVDDAANYITLEIGKQAADGTVEDGGEYLDVTTPGGEIVITFEFAGTPEEIQALLDSGSFTLGDYTTPAGAITYDEGTNSYSVKIPVAETGLSGKPDEVQIRYNPPLDQDNDLGNVQISVPVTNDTGFTGTLTSDKFDVAVDAVADLPKDVSGGVSSIDADTEKPEGWDKADWGSTVKVQVAAEFSDLADGSEKHYLMVEAKEGWSCESDHILITLYYDADGNLVYPDPKTGAYDSETYPASDGYTAKTFFAVDAENATHNPDGTYSAEFELKAPKDAASTNADDAASIKGDGNVDLATGGLAVEGTVSVDKDGNATLDVTAGKNGDEPRYDNNLAFGESTVEVGFNVINDGDGHTQGAYEDHMPDKNDNRYGVMQNDGKITIELDDPSGNDRITTGEDAENTLSFTFPEGQAPGTFSYTDANGTHVLDPVEVAPGKWEVAIPDAAIGPDGRSVNLTYNPPAFNDTDLTDVTYSLDSHATDSTATGKVEGSIDTVDAKGNVIGEGKLIVDAVADKPAASAGKDNVIDYGPKQGGDPNHPVPAEAARPGQDDVRINTSVTFRDIEEGGESHYLVIKTGNLDGLPGMDGFTAISGKDALIAELGKTVYDQTVRSQGADFVLFKVDDAIDQALQAWKDGGSQEGFVYDKIPGVKISFAPDPHNPGHFMATVNTTATVAIPDTGIKLDPDTGAGQVNVSMGGYTVDRDSDTDGDQGLRTNNDVAWDFKETPIVVETVGSRPSLSVTEGHIYENLTPNAHLDPAILAKYNADLEAFNKGEGPEPKLPDYALVEVNGKLYSVQPDGSFKDNDSGRIIHPADGGYKDIAENAQLVQPGQQAVMELVGQDGQTPLAAGETAEVTLIFSATELNGEAANFEGATVTVVIDGQESGPFPVDADGHVTINGIAAPNGESVQFKFNPGTNNSHADITVDYEITVTDDATGQSTTWGTTGKEGVSAEGQAELPIEVDAVAQAVEIGSLTVHGAITAGGDTDKITDDTYYPEVVRGETVFIDTVMDITDIHDGSQGLVLLVEATGAMLKPQYVILEDADGNTVRFDFPANTGIQGIGDDGAFYRLQLTEEQLKELAGLKEGNITVRYALDSSDTPANLAETQIRVGAITYEKDGVYKDGEGEATLDNNSSVVISQEGTIQFGTPPSFSISYPATWVSENDTTDPVVYPGAPHHGGGILALNVGADCEVTDLDFSGNANLGPDGAGQLYYIDKDDYGDVSKYGEPVTGIDKLEDGKILVFVPNENYSDADVSLGYTATVTNTQTGQSNPAGGNAEIFVDAVAQAPDVSMDVDGLVDGTIAVEHHDVLGTGQAEPSAPIKISLTFADYDPSEQHFALVRAEANMTVLYDPKGDGTYVPVPEDSYFIYEGVKYWKVPLSEVDGKGNGSVDIKLQFPDRLMAWDNPDTSIDIRGLSEEQVQPGDAGNAEKNFGNNYAVSDTAGELNIHHEWPGGPGTDGIKLWIDPVYENNTPNAQNDGPADGLQSDPTEGVGGQIHFPDADVASAEITIPEEVGYLCDKDGNRLTPDENGVYTVTREQVEDGVYFRPGKNYSDADLDISYVVKDSNGTSIADSHSPFPVVVDAVAQLPVDPTVDKVDYGKDGTGEDAHQWGALGDADGSGNEGLASITISAKFEDNDGSETHFALLEKKPGYTIVDGDGNPVTDLETVYLDRPYPNAEPFPDGPRAYYKVPMPAGEDSVDVHVKVDTGAFNGKGGSIDIETGVMTEETGTKDSGYEYDTSNNVSWNLADDGKGSNTATIEYSPVDTTIGLAINNTGENDGTVMGQNGEIAVTVTLGEHDVLQSLEFTYNPEAGTLVWDGGRDTTGTVDLYELLKTSGFDFDSLEGLTASQASAKINDALKDLGLRLSTGGSYGDGDITDGNFKVTATVKDTLSGDEAERSGTHGRVVVDAVADAPAVEDVSTSGTEEGSTAATAGGTLYAQATLHFDDVAADVPEQHYAMLGQHHEWPCEGVQYFKDGSWHDGELITFFDKNGKPYYAMKIGDDMLKDGDIQVRFALTAPDKDADTTVVVKIGGVSVEQNTGTPDDLELTLGNNWAESLDQTVELSVGVVETTGVELTMDGMDEDTATQMRFELEGGQNDSIKDVTVTDLDGGRIVDAQGKVLFEQRADGFYDADGTRIGDSLTLDGKTAQDGGYYYQAPANKDGDHTVDYQVTVRDNASGDTKTFPETGSAQSTVTVTGIADMPENVDVLPAGDGAAVDYGPPAPGMGGDPTAAKPGGTVSFEVSATFPDHDGSENHWILVEAREGWTCDGLEPVDGYFRIPVTGGYDADGKVTVEVKLTPPVVTADESVALQVGAMSQEKVNPDSIAQTAEAAMDTVTVNIGVADSTWDGNVMAEATAPGVEDGAGAAFTISFKGLTGQDGTNDEVTSVTIKGGLDDGYITDGTHRYYAGDALDAATLAKGGYSYVAGPNKSGTFSPEFDVTFRDTASGHETTVSGQVDVTVTPVTDVPAGQTAENGEVTVQAGHTATVDVTLSADFNDYTGTEEHFFLVQLPEGVTLSGFEPADPALVAAAGMTGNVYYVKATDADGLGTGTITLTLDNAVGEEWLTNPTITYKAGSHETDGQGGLHPDAVYAFSPAADQPGATLEIPADGQDFNLAPTLSSPTTAFDVLRTEPEDPNDPQLTVKGTVTMTDDDNTPEDNDIHISYVTWGDGSSEPTHYDGYYFMPGKYGNLTITEKGEYTYTLTASTPPPDGYQEVFHITAIDNWGGNNPAGSGTITITLNSQNAAPTAENQWNVSGGGSEMELANTVGSFVTTDTDGDIVSITGIAGGQEAANGGWELQGKYGKLVIQADGSYIYERTDEYAIGDDTFMIQFADALGKQGVEAPLTIHAQAVNHAPIAHNEYQYYGENSATALDGWLIGDGKTVDPDGDPLHVVSVTFDGEEYDLSGLPTDGNYHVLQGDDFTLKITADGEYLFIPKEDVGMGTGHSFTYTVSDGEGLVDSGDIFFGKGEESDFPHDGVKLHGTGGDDSLTGTDGNDILYGLDGNDTIHGGAGHDTIYGGAGHDTIYGGDGIDTIYGGSGDDLIYGGLGNDTMSGGAGADTFAWTLNDLGGTDTILDFEMGTDKLLFESLFSDTVPDLKAALDQNLIDVSVTDTSTVQVTMGDQVVDIHLTSSLPDNFQSFEPGDDSAKEALLQMMIAHMNG